MSTIKKAYTELHTLLSTALKAKNIDQAVFDDAVKLMSAKASGGTAASSFIKDAEGNVVAINCYYFKRWMPLIGSKAVEFGIKKSSTTGFNSMSKAGNSHWTKQLATSKKNRETLLTKVAKGEVKPADVDATLKGYEADRHAIAKTDLGFKTLKEVEAYLASPEAKADTKAVAPKAQAKAAADKAKAADPKASKM